MERNRFSRFDPELCKMYLSDFGKQVLEVLIQQLNMSTEQEQRTAYQERRWCRTEKTLNFNNESLSISIINAQSPPSTQIQNKENVDNRVKDTSEISSSTEIIKTFNIDDITKVDDFLHPTVVNSIIVNEELNREYNIEHQELGYEDFNRIVDNSDRKKMSAVVSWDNMFDSELCNFNDIVPENKVEHDNVNTANLFPKENNTIEFIFNEEKKNNKVTKRKNKSVENNINKKKKQDEVEASIVTTSNNEVPKQSVRKEKYTKTIKKWLNDINSCNTVEEQLNIEEISSTNNVTELTEKNNQSTITKIDTNTMFKMTVDKTVKSKKKVVQARLTNKDGVMKFSKPKHDVELKTLNISDNKESKDKKEKAIKKFIPPVKSQLPVKDTTYKILTVDDKNTEECSSILNRNITDKVIVILIYSNGFSQLNSHFTEGTCAVDGVLLSTGDMFFYFNGAAQNIRNILTPIIYNNTIVSYEARSVLLYLASYLQTDVMIKCYDAKIGASLLDPDNPPENFSELQKLIHFTASYTICSECTLQKAAWYMSLLDECWTIIKNMLMEQQLWQVFLEIEMRLLPIISGMQHRGVSVDLSKLKYMEEALLSRMKQVEQDCYKAAGKVFQINSTLQVGSILYDELQLDTKCNVKVTETSSRGVKSTSETMLRSLMSVHLLPKLILEYRHLHKAHATFLAGIAQHVKDGAVKPTWVQTAAATGRIASNNPNLQAIPKVPFSLVMFPDADQEDTLQVNFRSVYVSRPGFTFVAADFKHVECRVFAHAAADTGLLRALTSSEDLFRVLAAQWLHVPEGSVSPGDRERTKHLVYASLYGAGPRRLMEILDVSYEQALQVAASFNRTFPSLKCFGRRVVGQCSAAAGRLTTLCGRVRHFHDISSKDFSLRSHAERQAVNFVVQGSAADLCKIAMIVTEEQLREHSPALDAHLVLQIHDELVWEVKDDHVGMVANMIKRAMEGCGQRCGLTVSLPVSITLGKNWADMEQYTAPTTY